MDIDRVAKAIEDDAGEPIEGLRESLAEMNEARFAREYTPESCCFARRVRRWVCRRPGLPR